MAPASGDLIDAAAAARDSARAAKAERAKAVDAVIDLVIERARLRAFIKEVLPILPLHRAVEAEALLRENVSEETPD